MRRARWCDLIGRDAGIGAVAPDCIGEALSVPWVGTAGLHRRGSTDCIFSGRTQRTGLHAIPRIGSPPLGCARWSTGWGDIGRGSREKTHPAISSRGHTRDGAARRGPGGRRPSIGAKT